MKLRSIFNIPAVLFVLLLSLPVRVIAQEDGEEAFIAEDYQAQIDSILSLITPSTPDSLLAKYYCEIANTSQIYDTIVKYANLSLSLCPDNNYILLASINIAIGRAYHTSDQNTLALPYMNKAIDILTRANESALLVKAYQNMTYIYDEINNLDSSVYYLTKTLEIGRRLGDTTLVAECYQDLGIMYGQRGLYDESKTYLRKALVLDSLSKNRFKYAMDLFCLVQLIDSQEPNSVEEYLTARDYLNKVVNVLDTVDTYQKYLAYGTFVSVYIHLAKLTDQHKYADSSLFYYKKAELFFEQAPSVSNYRMFRYYYVDYLLYYKKYDDALKVMHELGKNIDENTPVSECSDFHNEYKSIYLALGDYKNAYHHLEMQQKYDRASFNDSTLSALSDVKAQQISIIEKLEREKNEQIHAADKRRLHTLITALVCGLILVSLVIIYIQRAYNIKRKANKQLSEKNEILNSQKAEIMAQRDELASQRDEIMAQRDKIASQKDIITEQWHEVETVNQKLFSSINYAKRIQRAAVSSEDDVLKIFPDSFVFYSPRDIVSGDFYRCGRCGKYSVMITADCTGHGIPGAFLSMLGLSALKEYMVTENDAENPGTVLDQIRDFIKTTLASSQQGKNIDDGMDMTICCYDYEQMLMHYAIANQTAYIIRDGEAIKLKGDSMPVGRYIVEKEHFKSLTMPIQKGDMVYTFSDGIQDQIGGENNRKFLLKNLLALLVSLADKPAATQCQLLEKAILDWRGDIPQVDDMTLVGVRV